LDRQAERVARDVAGGYVSEAAARDEYGVVLVDGAVDVTATEALRASMPRHTEHFHYGPERSTYEQQWTDEAYDLLTDILADLPIHWRFFVKTEVFKRMEGRSGAAGVAAAFEEVCVRFPEVPRPDAHARAAE
jgi:N-methylhydantoinase B